MAVATKRVEFAVVGERQVRRRHGEQVLLQPVAPVVVGLRHGIVLVDHLAIGPDVVRRTARDLVGIRPRAIRRLAIEILRRQCERALAQPHAPAAAHVGIAAIARVVRREILAARDGGERREPAATHDHIDDAGDGVRTVLGRGAVAQHLDTFDRAAGEGVHVDAARTRGHAVRERVHHGCLVTAHAIHQHQRLVRRQTAQREGPDHVGGVGDGLAGEVHRRRQCLKCLARLGGALACQHLVVVHIHRHCQLVGRGVVRTGADHDLDGLLRDDALLELEVDRDSGAGSDRDRVDHRSEAEHEHAHRASALGDVDEHE